MTSQQPVVSIATITLKCADERALTGFWQSLLGYIEVDHPTDSIRLDHPEGLGPSLLLQPGPTPKATPNRFHLDLRPAHHQQAVRHALDLGAALCDIGQTNNEPWAVMTDPEGNEFCILQSIAERNQAAATNTASESS